MPEDVQQKILQKEPKRQNINCFDSWATIFAKKTTDFEFSVTNNIMQKEHLRYFIKVSELTAFYNEITDYRTAELRVILVLQINMDTTK